MLSIRAALLILAGLLCATTGLLAQEKHLDPDSPVVRVVYFIPSDRQVEPDFHARLDRVMTEVQRFYRAGMDQNGYGQISFELDRDAQGHLRVYEVQGKEPMRNYGRNASDKVRREVKDALARMRLDIDRETVVIFQLLLEWRDNRAVEIGPYVGGGGPRSGTAWVYDDARLDVQLLPSNQPGGYYNGPCSLGQFNTHYIGGVAHELGHAFGLPHDCEREVDRSRRGLSLMGGGNHTYGQEQRGEGRGTFLSAASALPLSVHPLFTGKRKEVYPPDCNVTELQAFHEGGTLTLTGRLQGRPKVIGVVAHNDQQATPGDYDAVGWICTPDAHGQFRLAVGELQPGEYDLRLAAYGDGGDARTFAFRYSVDRNCRPDLRPFAEWVVMQDANAAFRTGDASRLAEIVADLTKQEAGDLRRKVDHLKNLLASPQSISPSEVARQVKTVAAADLKFETAHVGWGKPLYNQVLAEGEASFLLEVGGTFYQSGLYAHAPAQHILRLDGNWTRFATEYGLQDGHDGSVVFIIKGDGRELFRSQVVRDHSARAQTVNVAKVKLLELLVEDAGDGGNSDWGVWLDPQLHR